MSNEYFEIPLKERNNDDLLELVLQLHSRLFKFPSEKMHANYLEARKELELRLKMALNKIEEKALQTMQDKLASFDNFDNKTFYSSVYDILKPFIKYDEEMVKVMGIFNLEYAKRHKNVQDCMEWIDAILVTDKENKKNAGH